MTLSTSNGAGSGPEAGETARAEAIRDAAAGWAARLRSGTASEADRQAFARWLAACDDHREAFHLLEQSWRDLDFAVAADPALDAETDRIAAARPSARAAGWRRGVAAAAALAASLLVAVGLWRWAGDDPAAALRYASAVGEIRTVTLPDGSDVTLAGASTLAVHFSRAERWVELERGQAYFDVAPEPGRAFSVRAAGLDVRVRGTAFDVQLGGSDVRVSVAEGVVEVLDLPDDADAAPAPSRTLSAGDRIYAALDGTLGEVRPFDPATLAAWRAGRLDYRNTPLARVIEEVNRYRPIKIVLGDETLADLPVTLSVPVDRTDLLLSGLELSEGVEIARQGSTMVIRRRRP